MRCFPILGAVLLRFAYGSIPNSETSIYIESGTGTNCTELTFKKFFVCLYRFGDFMAKMYFLDVKSQTSMNKFKTSCLSMADCTESFECQNNKERTDSKKVRESCETLNFLGTDFIPCLAKLEELKPAPECYKTWGPFDGFIIKDKTPDELCKNMVGKDNCMKKLVSETCGEEDSKKLYKMLKNTTEYRHCDFSKL